MENTPPAIPPDQFRILEHFEGYREAERPHVVTWIANDEVNFAALQWIEEHDWLIRGVLRRLSRSS